MRNRLNNIANERGAVTIYLALVFLVFLGFAFCVLEGIREYGASTITEDAVKSAGEDIRANYDRELFRRYHLFFLDPREKSQIENDGKSYLSTYFSGGILRNAQCTSLSVTEEKTAVDEDGLYLRHQIREWMKYRETGQIENIIKILADNVNQNEQKKEECLEETKAGEEAIRQEEKKEGANTEAENTAGQDTRQAEGEETKEGSQEKAQEKTQADIETEKKRATWKGISETMRLMMKSGILYYAVDDPEKISVAAISGTSLPSVQAGKGGGNSFWNQPFKLSLSGLKEMSTLFSARIKLDKGSFWNKEYYMVPYIQECFRCYGQKQSKKNAEKTVLSYEIEYMIGGKDTDRDNLKAVANRILRIRFVTNYIYAQSSPEITKEAGLMAAAVAGFLGMPQAVAAVELIIIGAMSYGESMLELHALMSGEEISVVKSKSTWNLRMETALQQLKKKDKVKKGKRNADYSDFLKLILMCEAGSDKICYRMMDLMQVNTALKESGFLMKDSLFSWKWEGEISVPKYFSRIPVFGLASSAAMKVDFSRVNSY